MFIWDEQCSRVFLVVWLNWCSHGLLESVSFWSVLRTENGHKEVCGGGERKHPKHEMHRITKQIAKTGLVLSDRIHERQWALINLLGSHARWHSDIIYRESPAIAKMVLLTDMSYLLHHISSCLISRCINTSLCLSVAHSYLCDRLAVWLLKLYAALQSWHNVLVCFDIIR